MSNGWMRVSPDLEDLLFFRRTVYQPTSNP